MSKNSYLKKAASLSFIVKIIGLLISFLLQIVLARTLNLSDFGAYNYLSSLSILLVAFCLLGFDKVSLKFIPEYIEKGISTLRYERYAIKAASLSSFLILTLILIFGAGYIEKTVDVSIELVALWCVSIFFMAISSVYAGLIQSIKKPVVSQFNELVLKPLVIMVGVGSVALNSQLKLYDALLLLLAASLLSALTNFICWKKMGSKYRHGSVAVSSGWMSTGLGFLGITLCNTALNQIDILMIGSMLGAEQGGIYSVAVKITNLLTLFLVAFNVVAAPMITAFYVKGDMVGLQNLLQTVSKYVSLFTVLCAICMYVFIDHLLALFGEQFSAAEYSIYILGLAKCVGAITGSASYLLSLTGYQKQVLVILSSSVALNIFLNYILIGKAGISGAALATAITMVIWNLAMFIFVLRVFNLNTTFVNINRS